MVIIIRSVFSPWTLYNNPLRVRLVPSVGSFYAKSYLDVLRERLSAYYSIRTLSLLPNYRIRFIGTPLRVTSFWGGATEKGKNAVNYANQLQKILKETNETMKKGGAKTKKEGEEKYGVEEVEVKKK